MIVARGRILFVLALALALVVALVVGGLPRSAAAEADTDALLADLDGDDVARRSAALTALRRDKPPRVPQRLVELLPTYGLMGRYYGVMVLESYPEKQARPAFVSLSACADPYLRLSSGRALLAWDARGAADLIVEALGVGTVPANERLYMVNRLYGVRDARVRAALRRLLDPDAEIGYLGSLLWTLGQQPLPEDIVAVRALATATPNDVRALALAFLLRHGEDGHAMALAEALASGDLAATPLYRINSFLGQAPHVPPGVLDAVASLLESEDEPYALRAAIAILTSFRYVKAAPAIQKLMRHENTLLAKSAFEAVAELGGGLDAEQLRPLLEASDDARRVSAAELLRRMDDPVGLPVIVQILRRGEKVADRTAAARALGAFTRRAAVDPLLDALMDKDAGVRTAALQSLDAVLRNLFPYRRVDLVAAGYTATSSDASRREAVACIRRWWERRREGGA